MNHSSPRAAAATILAELLQQKGSLTRLLPLHGALLEPRDRSLLAELCYGVCRFYPRLNGLLQALINKPLKAKDSDIKSLLLLGCYQLSYLRIPDHAAISETVAAARLLNKPWATGFINGVLRQYQRRRQQLEQQLSQAAALCHPEWLLQLLQQQWPQHWSAIVDANNSAPPMTLRVNSRRLSRDDYLQQLQQRGIAATACRWSPVGISLQQPCDVDALPGFADGNCSVQDEASQLVAPLLHPARQHSILDSCCAPGGKTGHLLELAGPDTVVEALDIDADRLARVQQNLTRLQLTARLILGDATQPQQWWSRSAYDAILVDAPCSGSGVIRRHPDIKLLRLPADIDKLNHLQSDLLHALWPCLRPGGTLLYTTCSVFQQENDRVMARFLQQTADAHCQPIERDWGVATRYGRQLLPQQGGADGFFYACLSKSASSN
jgi:16S rRNA (cytosine967-C5)-methyltransferase